MTWDLAHGKNDIAEIFFSSSNVTATLRLSSSSPENSKIEWTATTPVAVACGASVLVVRNDTPPDDESVREEFFWHHIFSQAMDPSVPSLDHVVSISLNDDPWTRFVDVATRYSIFDSHQDGLDVGANGDGTAAAGESKVLIAFRLFAFLPFGRGVLVSRIYIVEIDVNVISDLQGGVNGAVQLTIGEFNSTAPSESPALPFGESPLAFFHGICTDDSVITNSSSSTMEDMKTRNCNVDYELSVGAEVTESLVEFLINGIETRKGGDVAAAFQYGIDTRNISVNVLSAEAFHDSDGVSDEGEAIAHGLVRAQDVSVDPSAFISLISASSTVEELEQPELVVGGVWIDDQMIVYHSTQHRFPLANYVNPTQFTLDTDSGSQTHHNSTVCPSSPLANLALLSKGASVLSVSSNFGTSPSDVTSTYGGNKAIDEDPSTAWSSAGDGNDAFITISLPFPSNVVYVDFHTRTMVTSAQVSEYAVEVDGGLVVASGCEVLDANKPFNCEVIGYDGEIGARNVTEVTFRVVGSSGGNTGAVSVGIYGCAVGGESDSLPSSGESREEGSNTDTAVLSDTGVGVGGDSISDESKEVSSDADAADVSQSSEENKDRSGNGYIENNGSTAEVESEGFVVEIPMIFVCSSLLAVSLYIF